MHQTVSSLNPYAFLHQNLDVVGFNESKNTVLLSSLKELHFGLGLFLQISASHLIDCSIIITLES